MFGLFGNNDNQELETLKRRVYSLEQTVRRQQQILESLSTELSDELAHIPESLREDLNNLGPLHPDVVELLRQRKEIRAIKRHRELTGAGLAEAKHLIDAEKGKYL